MDYTPADFPEVNAVAVEDLTSLTVDWVKKKVQGIPTEEEMLVDVENFRRILSIKLAKKGKENVLKAVQILEQREDVQSSSPNNIFKLDD